MHFNDCWPAYLILPSQFANQEDMDFEDIEQKTPTQEFEVAQGREVGEYAVKYIGAFPFPIGCSLL
jgi:hypothetical protein